MVLALGIDSALLFYSLRASRHEDGTEDWKFDACRFSFPAVAISALTKGIIVYGDFLSVLHTSTLPQLSSLTAISLIRTRDNKVPLRSF